MALCGEGGIMVTYTPRIALAKPAAAGTEIANVLTFLNPNLDIMDTEASFEPRTAYPVGTYAGKSVVRTNLGDRPAYWQSGAAAWTAFPYDTHFVRKTLSENVNNTSAIQDDDELFIGGLIANATYIFDSFIMIRSQTSVTPDLRMTFTAPAGATYTWTPDGCHNALVLADVDGPVIRQCTTGTTHLYVGAVPGRVFAAKPKGLLRMGATPGKFQFQWSQQVTTAENVTVLAGSWMSLERVDT